MAAGQDHSAQPDGYPAGVRREGGAGPGAHWTAQVIAQARSELGRIRASREMDAATLGRLFADQRPAFAAERTLTAADEDTGNSCGRLMSLQEWIDEG